MDFNYQNDPARMASLMGQEKVAQMKRHQNVLANAGIKGEEARKQVVSNVGGMSDVERYHASKGTEGSIINKVLGGKFR